MTLLLFTVGCGDGGSSSSVDSGNQDNSSNSSSTILKLINVSKYDFYNVTWGTYECDKIVSGNSCELNVESGIDKIKLQIGKNGWFFYVSDVDVKTNSEVTINLSITGLIDSNGKLCLGDPTLVTDILGNGFYCK